MILENFSESFTDLKIKNHKLKIKVTFAGRFDCHQMFREGWKMDLDFIDKEAQARYIERRQLDLQRCRESLGHNDFSVLETVGHNLKGNGISFGYPELSTLGEELESSAKRSDSYQAKQFLDRLEQWIQSHQNLS